MNSENFNDNSIDNEELEDDLDYDPIQDSNFALPANIDGRMYLVSSSVIESWVSGDLLNEARAINALPLIPVYTYKYSILGFKRIKHFSKSKKKRFYIENGEVSYFILKDKNYLQSRNIKQISTPENVKYFFEESSCKEHNIKLINEQNKRLYGK